MCVFSLMLLITWIGKPYLQNALSDGEQALNLADLPAFMVETSRIAVAMGRVII